MGLDFSPEAIELLAKLGFEHDPAREDAQYISSVYDVIGEEDIRLGHLADELEEIGLYPFGLTSEDAKRIGLCDEILNKLADKQGLGDVM